MAGHPASVLDTSNLPAFQDTDPLGLINVSRWDIDLQALCSDLPMTATITCKYVTRAYLVKFLIYS